MKIILNYWEFWIIGVWIFEVLLHIPVRWCPYGRESFLKSPRSKLWTQALKMEILIQKETQHSKQLSNRNLKSTRTPSYHSKKTWKSEESDKNVAGVADTSSEIGNSVQKGRDSVKNDYIKTPKPHAYFHIIARKIANFYRNPAKGVGGVLDRRFMTYGRKDTRKDRRTDRRGSFL